MTAVKRVDFRLHTPIVSGLMNKATAVDRAPSHPANEKEQKNEMRQSQHLEKWDANPLIENDS